ncbi:hypothetical protein ACFWZ2_28215 [Streptomyces sp. NPDC059002]|uniref:hypothetical protein n=1 Tax=Streptomyces sp. NPDC059002 TaxID=3346690 RepID=UPI00368B6129
MQQSLLGLIRARREGRTPPPAAPPGDSQVAEGGRPFDFRVRVLVEIQEDPDEIALAQELLTACGWPVREPKSGEYVPDAITPSYVARVVEVRLLGSRRGVAAHAAYEVDRVARRAGLPLRVREAALVEREPVPIAHRYWEVVPVHTPWFDRVLDLTGSRSKWPEHFLGMPKNDEGEPDTTELSATLGTQRLDPATHRLHRVTSDAAISRFLRIIGLGLLLEVALWAGISYGRDLLRDQPPLWLTATGYGVLVVISLSMSVVTTMGLQHASRYSGALRQVLPWLVPLAVPALIASLPQIGGVTQDAYVSAFGLPGAAATSWADSLEAGVFVALGALLGLGTGIGVGGLLHRSLARTGLSLGLAMAAGLLLGTIGAALQTYAALDLADVKAAQDRRALAAGATPVPFYGIEAHFVCAHPTTKAPPVYGGPLPTTRPLVTFGPDGDRISLWDPGTKRALSMRLEDASFTPARTEEGRAVCPQGR